MSDALDWRRPAGLEIREPKLGVPPADLAVCGTLPEFTCFYAGARDTPAYNRHHDV
jgi:hypothetical protein